MNRWWERWSNACPGCNDGPQRHCSRQDSHPLVPLGDSQSPPSWFIRSDQKRQETRGLWLKITWYKLTTSCLAWPDDGQLLLANPQAPQSPRLFLPRPSSASSSYNPSPWEILQAAARLVVSFPPVFLPHPKSSCSTLLSVFSQV